MSNDTFIPNSWTSIEEVKYTGRSPNMESGVRVYGYSPGHIALQIRHRGPTVSGGVLRNMVAHTNLSVKDALALRDRLNAWLIEQGVDLD